MAKKKRRASIEYLEELLDFVAVCAKKEGFSARRIKNIELVTEESLVNIINYAYPERIGDVEVTCSAEDDSRFIIEISDEGTPFDILSHPAPDLTADIPHREVGGLGGIFIRKFVNDASYSRAGGRNVLSLVFCRNQETITD